MSDPRHQASSPAVPLQPQTAAKEQVQHGRRFGEINNSRTADYCRIKLRETGFGGYKATTPTLGPATFSKAQHHGATEWHPTWGPSIILRDFPDGDEESQPTQQDMSIRCF